MGIHGLTKLLSDEAPGCMKEVDLDCLTGRKVAIDASMAMYQFLVSSLDAAVGTGHSSSTTLRQQNHVVKCITFQCMQAGYIFAMQLCLLSTHTALVTTFLVARAVSIFHNFEFEFAFLYTNRLRCVLEEKASRRCSPTKLAR